MDVNENNHIPVEEDIKKIAQDLLKESKTQKIIRIRYFDDKTNNEPSVLYRRFESVPQMQEMGLLEIIKPIECNPYPRNFWEGDLNIVQNPIYKVRIFIDKLKEEILAGQTFSQKPPKPLPKGLTCDDSKIQFTLEFRDRKKLEFYDMDKPSARYFKILFMNHGLPVKHELAIKELELENYADIRSLVKALKEKIEHAGLKNKIKIESNYKSAYTLTISS